MDLSNYVKVLDNNSNDILQLAKSCSIAQLTFKQDNKWSILQILEHICIVDKICFSIISRPVSEKISETSEIYGSEKIKVDLVANRNRKIETPEILRPKDSLANVIAFDKIFSLQRGSIKNDLLSGKIIVDNKSHKHPFLGEMTIADWLYFIIHHTQRHIEQIKDQLNEI